MFNDDRPQLGPAKECHRDYEREIKALKAKWNAVAAMREALLIFKQAIGYIPEEKVFTFPGFVGALVIEEMDLQRSIAQCIEAQEKER